MEFAPHPLDSLLETLPEVDGYFEGGKAWLLQGTTHQVVFIKAAQDVAADEHEHEEQWGIIVDGEVEMTIDGEPRKLSSGDAVHIPPFVRHSGKALAGGFGIDIFHQVDRFKAKTAE